MIRLRAFRLRMIRLRAFRLRMIRLQASRLRTGLRIIPPLHSQLRPFLQAGTQRVGLANGDASQIC